ncbi:MAG: penicillin-binding protein [Bacilli bacterium]|nr:penicillin-binding protein [Bacilli bacterium]
MKLFKKIIKINITLFVIVLLGIISLYVLAYFSPVLDIKTSGQYYIYDDNNNIVYQGSGTNKWVSLEDISDNLKDAIISIEDKNFYKHKGFDYFRIIKTLIKNIENKEIVGGASTISQQYVKNLYLDFDKNWERKIQEAWLTLKLEMHFTKDEILEGYLNTINFGQGNYGIENASEYYFNKSAKDLTKEEAIILAGIPKSPNNYNPITSYDNAIARAKVVAASMVNNKIISNEEKQSLFNNTIEIYGEKSQNNLSNIMYFQDAVKQELETIDSVPKTLIETGGLKIFTSLNIKAQEYLENSIKNNMNDDDMQVASIIIDPNNGNIKALVGGKSYAKSQYNRAISSERQVGSTMKPLLYYAALENGMTGASTFLSEATTFMFSNNQSYSPSNYNQKYANKEITMAAAISYSDNIYAVKTHLFLGEETLVDTAKRMGIKKELDPVPSLPLGTNELSMIDFANAYTTLASGGFKKDLSLISRVEDLNGNILYEKKDKNEQVLNGNYVYILNELLTSTYNSSFKDYNIPTIISLSSKISRKYAMKSGSTNTDCWMVGYNKDFLMMVWNGYDDNREMKASDGNIAKNIWVETAENYLKDKETSWYEKPTNVVGVPLNAITGQETTNNSNMFIFYFVKGSEDIKESYVNKVEIEE